MVIFSEVAGMIEVSWMRLGVILAIVLIVLGAATATAQPFKHEDKHGSAEPMVNTGCPTCANATEQHNVSEHVGEHEKHQEIHEQMEKKHEVQHGVADKHKIANEEVRKKMKEKIKERITDMQMKKNVTEIALKVKEIRKICNKAKENYLMAKKKYMELKTRGLNDPEAFRWAKQYVHSGVDYAEKWLERLKVQVQNANMGEDQKERLMVKIENCLMALEEKKAKINNSKDPEELKEAVKELRKTWMDVKVEIRSIVGLLATSKLEVLVSKAEDVVAKLEGEIVALEASGVDVSKLKELLNESKENLDLAREKLEEAYDKFEGMADADNPNEVYTEAKQLLKEARKYMRAAFADIKTIYREIRQLRVGQVFYGNETGELLVVGSGSAEVQFSGVMVVLATGNVTVNPSAAIVTATGFEENVEGGVSKLSGDGKVVIRGKNVAVKVDGDFMRIFVKGKGTATLEGEGIYKLKKTIKEKMIEDTFSESVTLEFGVLE